MKNKGLLALALGVVAMMFSTMSYSIPRNIDLAPAKVTKPASKLGPHMPDSGLNGGAGPMCYPAAGDVPCKHL